MIKQMLKHTKLVVCLLTTAGIFFCLGRYQVAGNSASTAGLYRAVEQLTDSVSSLKIKPTEVSGEVGAGIFRRHSLECDGIVVQVPWFLTKQKNSDGICGGLFEQTIVAVAQNGNSPRAEDWKSIELCQSEFDRIFSDDLTFLSSVLNFTSADFQGSAKSVNSKICSVILLGLKAQMIRETSGVYVIKIAHKLREAIQFCEPKVDRKCKILVYERGILRTQLILSGEYDQDRINFIVSNLEWRPT
jgi:hypothetical protein